MRPRSVSSFPHRPPGVHTHPDLPTACRSTGEQPEGTSRKRGGGQGSVEIWPSLTETNRKLPKEGVFPSHFPAALVPAYSSFFKATPLTPPGCHHPAPSALRSPVFTRQSVHGAGGCRLSPLPREQAPLGLHSSPPFPKPILARVLRTRWLLQGLSFHVGPSPAPLTHRYLVP